LQNPLKTRNKRKNFFRFS